MTNAISLKPRFPTRGDRLLPYPGGLLVHTGHPNPGLRSALRKYSPIWRTFPCPVIPHVLADSRGELNEMVEALEESEGVAAVEIGLQPEVSQGGELIQDLAAWELPVLVRVPVTTDLRTIGTILEAGPAALVLGPPRGSMMNSRGEIQSGTLYGPHLFPLLLESLKAILVEYSTPVIAGAGIYRSDQIQLLFRLGVMAVQLDTVLWTDPDPLLHPTSSPQDPSA